MHLQVLILFLGMFSVSFAQDSLARNAVLRKEYVAIKKEGALVLSKVKPLEATVNTYKSEVDSLLKGMHLNELVDERIKLIHYRDSMECGGLAIDKVVDFYAVMPENDLSLPFERLKIIQSLHKVETISPTVVLDSLPISKENIRLASAIFLIGRAIDFNTSILEQFPEAKANQSQLLKDLKALSQGYNQTRIRISVFNQQLADTMLKWRSECGGTWKNCKICGHHSIPSKVVSEPPYDTNEIPAEFIGGTSALKQFLKTNLIYPPEAKSAGIEGKCYLKFVICEDGSITNVQVSKGIPECPECDKEAVRLVYTMPNFKPAKKGKDPIRSYYTLPVYFKLN